MNLPSYDSTFANWPSWTRKCRETDPCEKENGCIRLQGLASSSCFSASFRCSLDWKTHPGSHKKTKKKNSVWSGFGFPAWFCFSRDMSIRHLWPSREWRRPLIRPLLIVPLFRLTIDREVEEVGRVRPIVLPAKSSKVAAAIHLGEEDKRIRREREWGFAGKAVQQPMQRTITRTLHLRFCAPFSHVLRVSRNFLIASVFPFTFCWTSHSGRPVFAFFFSLSLSLYVDWERKWIQGRAAGAGSLHLATWRIGRLKSTVPRVCEK